MKKLLIGILAVSLLAGCSSSTGENTNTGSKPKEEVAYYQLDEKEVANAIKGDELKKITKENPVKAGQWVEIKVDSAEENGEPRTLYYRLNKVTKKSENEKAINDAIEANNSNIINEGIGLKDDTWEYDKNSDLVLVDYEYYIPKDFEFSEIEKEDGSLMGRAWINAEGKDVKPMQFFKTEVTAIDLMYKEFIQEYKNGYSYPRRSLFSINKDGNDYILTLDRIENENGIVQKVPVYFAGK